MTLIEVRGRGGQLIERFRSDRATISIGRAFDNDLILEDEFVSPHHLRLTRLETGWQLEDLDSLNGVRPGGGAQNGDALLSGGQLRIGQTTLCVYAAEHPTAPARPLEDAEEQLAFLGRHAIWLGLLGVSALVSAIGMFWGSIDEFKPLRVLSPISGDLLVTGAVAAVWALVGRLLRHRAYFLAHLSIWLCFALFSLLASFVAQCIGYNASSAELEQALDLGLTFVVLAATLWASLTLATHLPSQRRVWAALGVSLLSLGMSLADEFQFDRGFSSRPDYYSRMQGPAFLWAEPLEEHQLLDTLPSLFDRADEDIEDDSDDLSV